MQSFPEVDRVGWFGLDEARRKLIAGQAPFIDSLLQCLQGHGANAEQPPAAG
jgi:predicted NUDIX family NTP pyrophosphohydrolase